VVGAGPLDTIGTLTFGGAAAPYAVAYPDVLGAAAGGTIVLRYADGRSAAAGNARHSVLAGFPLESIDRDETRALVTESLLHFVGH
jgi:hypothetical protein